MIQPLKNENLSFVVTWIEMEDITLSEISQTQGDKYCSHSNGEAENVDPRDRERRKVVTRG
jgi:hypothetical protein